MRFLRKMGYRQRDGQTHGLKKINSQDFPANTGVQKIKKYSTNQEKNEFLKIHNSVLYY